MYSIICLLTALGAYPLSQAQQSVPSDLSSAFDPEDISIQVSYDEQSDNGFTDGTLFTPQQTFQTPTFAFGDASGVNTQLTTILMMLDTTSDDQRVLHYLQPGFQATEDKTAISSHAQPVQVYKGPGTLGDTGLRNYSFLMFQQFNDPFSPVYVPSLGSTFDVEGFLAKNKLQPALAGIGMQLVRRSQRWLLRHQRNNRKVL
ncbi:MAG: hypothetical protein LQ340_005868 [Diploschistes diacapsis]|nr:MAG: hypothetical protein LQ340_005868 [Diploschistes diacapsis]